MMLHEIMHTLGIEHEMKRTDRDKFVEVRATPFDHFDSTQ